MPLPIPALQNDTALAIFAHSSVRSPEQTDRAECLAYLGGKVLHMVTADTLFEKKPTLNAVDYIVRRSSNLGVHIVFISTSTLPQLEFEQTLSSDGQFHEKWVSFYKLREKVACPYALRAELKEPGVKFLKMRGGRSIYVDSRLQPTQQLFDAYVGAAYVEQGYSNTKAWIQSLVDPDFVPTSVGGSSMGTSTDKPPLRMTSPPPLPNNSPGSGVFLAKFNESAMRNRVDIKWDASKSGDSAHLLTWNVDCVGKYS